VAGFLSPLFVLGLAASGVQGGFTTPLPLFPAGSTGLQAGFRTPLPLFPAGGGLPTPDPIIIRNRGTSNAWRDEEEILAVIMAIAVRDS